MDKRTLALGIVVGIALMLLWPDGKAPREPAAKPPAVTAPRVTPAPRPERVPPWYGAPPAQGSPAPQGYGGYPRSPYGGYSFRGDDWGAGSGQPARAPAYSGSYPYREAPRFRFRPEDSKDARDQRFSGGFVPPGETSALGYESRSGSESGSAGAYEPWQSGYDPYGFGEGGYGARQPWEAFGHGQFPSWQQPDYGVDGERPWETPAYAPAPAPTRDAPNYRSEPFQPWERPGSGYPSPYSSAPELELFSNR